MPLGRLLAAVEAASAPPVLAPTRASQLRFSRHQLLHAFRVHRDLRSLLLRTHPHLTLEHCPVSGRCTFAARALPAGSTVLREAAFASVSLRSGTSAGRVDTLRVFAGNGSPAAALPFYLQQEPNLSLMEAEEAASSSSSSSSNSPPSFSALALIAPALQRNGFVFGESLLSVQLAALTNHSCQPNVRARLAGTQCAPEIAFTALRDISAGEEIFVSYIDAGQSFAARRERLTATYGFHCRCARCQREALQDPSPCACAECAAGAPLATA